MNLSDVRSKFLAFYQSRGHAILPSAPLVPDNDPTTLFTGSGMQPMVPYLLGEKHPEGKRLADSQKCFRAEDIEEVGDNRHTTFFEMLGNWSLGDYFKADQLRWIFTFLTDDEEGLGLNPEKLYVTVFAGDEELGLPRDEESVKIWKQLFAEKGMEAKDVFIGTEEAGDKDGMQGGRIFYYEAKKNWWSRSGVPAKMPVGEPGGPDSEIFYDFGEEFTHPDWADKEPHPNSDSGRFIEVCNSVFMEYVKTEQGFEKLPQQNVDFGGGLERMAAATNGNPDVFLLEEFQAIIKAVAAKASVGYEENPKAYRVVADHLRAAVFMIGDGIIPSNTEQGYFVRRLLRRSVLWLDKLGVTSDTLAEVAGSVIQAYENAYPNLAQKKESIKNEIAEEEKRFRTTIEKGMREFEKLITVGPKISGQDAFTLFSTYGFPLEMTVELAEEREVVVDVEGYQAAFSAHQAESRAGAEQKFKGGLGDTSEMSVKYHTATHLLNAALRKVLGEHVEQRGSNITPERLRFDFVHGEKMTDEEKLAVEKLVNDWIQKDLPVSFAEMSVEAAREIGAMGVFGDRYGEVVKVYTIGDEATEIASREICGGPHVTRTGELTGTFKIKKEEASSAGVRRIKAVLV